MNTERAEGIVQVLILIVIGLMAGAASFTHVHNWTMGNAPRGTGSWFGWANAVISELTPTAAGIEIRRRKRSGQPVTYPTAILIAAAVLSLSAQVSQARPTVGGWISSAVPALAFLALTKLVFSRPTVKADNRPSATAASPGPVPGLTATNAPVSATTKTPSSAPVASPAPAPAPFTRPGPDNPAEPAPAPSGQLLMSGRMAAFAHQQQTGQPITPGQLAERMSIPPALAESLLAHLGGTDNPPVTNVNGTALNGSRP